VDAFTRIGELFISRVLPMILIIGIGFVVHKAKRLDIPTLNKLNLYVLVPAILFDALQMALDDAGVVVALVAAHVFVLGLLGYAVSSLLRLDRETTAGVTLGGMLANCGNFGLPLMELAYGAAALGYQAIVLVVTNLLTFSVGIGVVTAGRKSVGEALVSFLKLPTAYVIAAALVMRHYGIQIWEPAGTAIGYVAKALIPVALITLGAQLADVRRNEKVGPVLAASLIRLFVSPCLMFGLVTLAGLTGLAAKVLVLGAAAPTAVNTVILAIEFENRPALAANIVLLTTLACAVTVSVTLYLVGLVF